MTVSVSDAQDVAFVVTELMNLSPEQRRKKVANLVAYAEQHPSQRAFVITVLRETTRRLSQD